MIRKDGNNNKFTQRSNVYTLPISSKFEHKQKHELEKRHHVCSSHGITLRNRVFALRNTTQRRLLNNPFDYSSSLPPSSLVPNQYRNIRDRDPTTILSHNLRNLQNFEPHSVTTTTMTQSSSSATAPKHLAQQLQRIMNMRDNSSTSQASQHDSIAPLSTTITSSKYSPTSTYSSETSNDGSSSCKLLHHPPSIIHHTDLSNSGFVLTKDNCNERTRYGGSRVIVEPRDDAGGSLLRRLRTVRALKTGITIPQQHFISQSQSHSGSINEGEEDKRDCVEVVSSHRRELAPQGNWEVHIPDGKEGTADWCEGGLQIQGERNVLGSMYPTLRSKEKKAAKDEYGNGGSFGFNDRAETDIAAAHIQSPRTKGRYNIIQAVLSGELNQTKDYAELARQYKRMEYYRSNSNSSVIKVPCLVCGRKVVKEGRAPNVHHDFSKPQTSVAMMKISKVFFPCEHMCICDICFHERGKEGFLICPLCHEGIKLVLDYKKGDEVNEYWDWIYQVKPLLSGAFRTEFRNNSEPRILESLSCDASACTAETQNSSGACIIS